jgi:hypothetical protein
MATTETTGANFTVRIVMNGRGNTLLAARGESLTGC